MDSDRELGVAISFNVGVYEREGHTVIDDVEVWLVSFVERPGIVIWNFFCQPYDLIWGEVSRDVGEACH